MKERRDIDRSTKGAVMVEFLAVFMPIFAFFLGLVQLIFIQTASLVTNHAAHVAVRAAVVLIPDKVGGEPGNAAGKMDMIERAARVPLSTLGLDQGDVNVTLNGVTFEKNDTVTVTLTVEYTCRVPLGGLIACGGPKTTLTAEASMANHGAEYIF